MPELGESVTEGTVTRWLKQVGDDVEVDEPLLEVSTDKVDTEIPSPVAGTLLEITVGRGRDRRGRRPARRDRRRGGAAPSSRSRSRSPSRSPSQSRGQPAAGAAAGARRGGAADAERRRRRGSADPAQPPGARARPADAGQAGARLRHPADPQARRRARRRPRRRSRVPASAAASAAGRAGRRGGREARAASREPEPSRRERPRRGAQRLRAAARGAPPPGAAADGPQPGTTVEAAAPPPGHRPEHDESLDTAAQLTTVHRGRRHPRRAPARPGEGRLRAPRGRQAVVPAVLREGRDRGAQGLPGDQRVDRRRAQGDHLPRPASTWRSRSTPRAGCSSR